MHEMGCLAGWWLSWAISPSHKVKKNPQLPVSLLIWNISIGCMHKFAFKTWPLIQWMPLH
jgi:hypothetical protein